MSNQSKILSVTSGKGGVGKTVCTVNLALFFKQMGYSILVFDGDMGLANVDVVLGLTPNRTIEDVLNGKATLDEIILNGPMGIRIIPSGSGVRDLTDMSMVQKQILLEQIEGLNEKYDLMIIDTGAGISESVLQLNAMSDQILVITTPEPHAMTDAYALMKVLSEEYGRNHFNLLVHFARSQDEASKVYNSLSEVAKRFLDIHIDHLGYVPHDPQIQKSVMQRRAASVQTSHTVAGQSWKKVAHLLLEEKINPRGPGTVQEFWRNLVLTNHNSSSHNVALAGGHGARVSWSV